MAGADRAEHPVHVVDRWLALLLMSRLLGAAVAICLLAVHRVTAHDDALIALTAAYTATSLAVVYRVAGARRSPLVWIADGGVALAFVWLSEDWRSPLYVFALTALVLPVTTLPFRAGLAWGMLFAAAYGVTGVLTERLGTDALEDTIRLETAATHLMVPVLTALALAYASDLLRRLSVERERAERFAVQAERERIAWDLHDSAKQRVHAAHLILSALPRLIDDGARPLVEQALAELRGAGADMDTSVAQLREPVDALPVDLLLRRRAEELAVAARTRIDVGGSLPELAPTVAAHVYRIVAEALTNAVRHADPSVVTVRMDPRAGSVAVSDDGGGMPERLRPGSHGLRTMRDRADTIGARIELEPGPGGRGTTVRLTLPPAITQGAEP